jgi:hypothetical protein
MANINLLLIHCPFGTIPSNPERSIPMRIFQIRATWNDLEQLELRCLDAAPDSRPDGKKGSTVEVNRSNGQPETVGCGSRRTRSGDDSLDGVMRRNKVCSMASQGIHLQFKRRTRQLGPNRDDSGQLGTPHAVVSIHPRLAVRIGRPIGTGSNR